MNALFTIQTVLVWANLYCFAICESGNIFLNNLSDSYSNRQIVYNNNIGHENFSPGNFKSQWIFCGTKLKSRLLFAVTKLIYVALYQLHPDEHN